jgi:hypothetical protein
MNRQPRSREDLLQGFQEQITLLEHECAAFDGGFVPVAKRMAVGVRVLLHQTRRSKSLLQQLGLRDKAFLDTAGPVDPRNLLTENRLCMIAVGDGARYLPILSEGPGRRGRTPFERWWNSAVIRDHSRTSLSRRELVLHVADTDDGAHADAGPDPSYMALSRHDSLAWAFPDGTDARPLPSPVPASIRQVVHEVLVVLREKAEPLVRGECGK